ncbi:hypothetical protein HDV06_005426 [Boothiomyces sp. JEL0866]|nr:hypothetical protein HDV06_005426 [Boothiomyces sp. JEL0866]
MNVGWKLLKGKQSYGKILELQEYLVKSRKTNTFLLLEHSPTYTVGRRIKEYDSKDLIALGADFYSTKRGGEITFHGPGQLVGYPILNLTEFNLGVRDYICTIQNTVIDTCKEFGIKAKSTEHTGIWIDDRKIAAIGIQVQRHVTSHGFALNCNTELKWFEHIIPCGLKDKFVTSVSKETGKNVDVEQVLPVLLDCFGKRFKSKVVPLSELNSSLDSDIDSYLK